MFVSHSARELSSPVGDDGDSGADFAKVVRRVGDQRDRSADVHDVPVVKGSREAPGLLIRSTQAIDEFLLLIG